MSLKGRMKIRWHKFLCNKLDCHDWRITREEWLRIGFDGSDGNYPVEQKCKYCEGIKIIHLEVNHCYWKRITH